MSSQITAFKSKWFVGSSSMRRVGSMKRALARLTRIRQPPENLFVDLNKNIVHILLFSLQNLILNKNLIIWPDYFLLEAKTIFKIGEEKEFLIKKIYVFLHFKCISKELTNSVMRLTDLNRIAYDIKYNFTVVLYRVSFI